jgi:hypothetical protein
LGLTGFFSIVPMSGFTYSFEGIDDQYT